MPMKDDHRNPFWGDAGARKRRLWPWILGVVACLIIGSLVFQNF